VAVCVWCDREMTDRVSCTVSVLHIAGEPYRLWRSPASCGDCGAPRGGLHHIGCDAQRCPCCRGQLIGCRCIFDEDLEEPIAGPFVGPVSASHFDGNGEAIHLYKHRDTRRYLNLDNVGNAYAYRGHLDYGDAAGYACYQQYGSLRDALDALDVALFDAEPPLYRSFPPGEWPADPPGAAGATL